MIVGATYEPCYKTKNDRIYEYRGRMPPGMAYTLTCTGVIGAKYPDPSLKEKGSFQHILYFVCQNARENSQVAWSWDAHNKATLKIYTEIKDVAVTLITLWNIWEVTQQLQYYRNFIPC